MKQIGRYRLDSVHGVGAFATVWRGWDIDLESPVAIKILADNWVHHSDVRRRFLDEARILRRIVDPRVVRVLDVGVAEDRPYFVMDFLAGGTLADRVGHLDADDAVELAVESARAVQALHRHGVLHRDIKPANLLIHDGRVLISDLGSAKRLVETSGFTLTTGSPSYMAPEQVSGGALDERCDVYSLGVLAYELLTGRLPFEQPLGRQPQDRPHPTGLGTGVDRVLSEAMALRAAARTPSAAAFADALSHAGLARDHAWQRALRPAATVLAMIVTGAASYLAVTQLFYR